MPITELLNKDPKNLSVLHLSKVGTLIGRTCSFFWREKKLVIKLPETTALFGTKQFGYQISDFQLERI